MSLFIPCKPSNVILSKMFDLALRADLKETFSLLFKLVFFLYIQTFYQVLFAQVYSEIDSDLFVFSHQDCFVNMIRTRV